MLEARGRSAALVGLVALMPACGALNGEHMELSRPPVPRVASMPGRALAMPPPPFPDSVADLARGALLLDDLGTLHRTVTASNDAQTYFDQGLRLLYAFNHDEAARSFAAAATIDASCAMCFWGVSLALGPNYNAPRLPENAKIAWEALRAAQVRTVRGTPVEQALVAALAHRYQGPEPLGRGATGPLDESYAAAMREVAARYPDDPDAQVLFAESLMDVHPWKLWTHDGQPAAGTEEIVAVLERALERWPDHPGANHYYIHAIEASPHPERALPSADRLPSLMPGAGHLVHMPAHIYQRVGRYADASWANARAVAVDLAYLQKTKPPGHYAMYLGHNYGFLAFSSSMEGHRAKSLDASARAAEAIPPDMIDTMPGMDFFVAEPLLAMVRFGRWDEILAEPRPDARFAALTVFWLHARGMALAAKGKLAAARADLDELRDAAARAPIDLRAGNNMAHDVFAVAGKILEARIATVARKPGALALWDEAVRLADQLAYSEPDDWFYPVRHLQGAALLAAGKAKEAEAVYREDLRRHPANGWALFGLWKALAAEGRDRDASAAQRAFEAAWASADVMLTASAF